MGLKTLLAACLVVLGLAGCTSEPQPKAVDFGDVDSSQRGADFTLRVKVVGIENGTVPLADAFVGVAEGSQALARATTGSDGVATLRIRSGQTVRVVAEAAGWTIEDSGRLRIGDKREASESCATTLDSRWCVVTSHSESGTVQLEGDSASIGITLFRERVRQSFQVNVEPRARLGPVGVPDSKHWVPGAKPLSDDPNIDRLHFARLEKAGARLTWRNDLLAQGDFELGVGCLASGPSGTTGTLAPYLLQQSGSNTLRLDWTPPQSGGWATCSRLLAGPVVDSVATGITTTVDLDLLFRGRSLIIPVGT